MELLAEVSDVGAGTVGVFEALILTVAVAAVGAVQASAAQSHDTAVILTAIVLVVPEFVPQSAKVVVMVSVSDTVDEIWLPYWLGSMVKVLAPAVTEESLITAHPDTAPLELEIA